ncbi:hypothetical protein [Haploplasma axanthum]|nr:hypothetical protein [Haploplasma axanthum]
MSAFMLSSCNKPHRVKTYGINEKVLFIDGFLDGNIQMIEATTNNEITYVVFSLELMVESTFNEIFSNLDITINQKGFQLRSHKLDQNETVLHSDRFQVIIGDDNISLADLDDISFATGTTIVKFTWNNMDYSDEKIDKCYFTIIGSLQANFQVV